MSGCVRSVLPHRRRCDQRLVKGCPLVCSRCNSRRCAGAVQSRYAVPWRALCHQLMSGLRQVSATTKAKVWPKTCQRLFIGIQPLQLKAMRRRSSISVCNVMCDRSMPSTHEWFASGFCYYKGEGVAKDLSKAVHWYTAAAVQGFAPAQYNLGRYDNARIEDCLRVW